MHSKFIDDVVYEISVSSQWRNAIFSLAVDQQLLISKNSVPPLPSYVKPYFLRYNLQYIVCATKNCPEAFDEGLVVFKFSPKSFPKTKRYSGNNPTVI
jgi:hypothetical protein